MRRKRVLRYTRHLPRARRDRNCGRREGRAAAAAAIFHQRRRPRLAPNARRWIGSRAWAVSVGLEPHESPTTPPHRRDGRTRCRPMQAAASTAPAILAAARRHAPARKRGYRRRSRAACVVIRAAPGPLFDVTAAPGAGRCAPDPRPLSHPPDPPARRPLHCAPARAPIAKSQLSSAVRAPHMSRERRRVCGRAVPCTSRRHRAENPAHSAPTEAAGGRWPIATIVTKCSLTGSSPSCLGW